MNRKILLFGLILVLFLSACQKADPQNVEIDYKAEFNKIVEKESTEIKNERITKQDNESDQELTKEPVKEDDENVKLVKGGRDNNYQNITYGEAFAKFFEQPEWRSYRGTIKNYMDSTFAEELKAGEEDPFSFDVVEFSGYCIYHGEKVKVVVQFNLDKETGIFLTQYLSFNDKEQDRVMILALLNSVFTYKGGVNEITAADVETAWTILEKEDEELEKKISEDKKKVERSTQRILEEEKNTNTAKEILNNYYNHIQSIAQASRNNYPTQTYEKAFNQFFRDPQWRYFNGTNERGETADIVEFTGFFDYYGKEVLGTIQFRISDDKSRFFIESFQMGEQYVNKEELGEVIDFIFEENQTNEVQYNQAFSGEEFKTKDHFKSWAGIWTSKDNHMDIDVQYLGDDKYYVYVLLNEFPIKKEYFIRASYGEYSAMLHFDYYLLATTQYDNELNIIDYKSNIVEEAGTLDNFEQCIEWKSIKCFRDY